MLKLARGTAPDSIRWPTSGVESEANRVLAAGGGPLLAMKREHGTMWGIDVPSGQPDGWSAVELFMPKEKALEVDGVVTEALANTRFRVQLETGHKIIAHVAGRMRKHFIRIVPGDKVRVELSPYDLTKGRITYRER